MCQAELRANKWDKAVKAGRKVRLTGNDITDHALTQAQKDEKKRLAWEKVIFLSDPYLVLYKANTQAMPTLRPIDTPCWRGS